MIKKEIGERIRKLREAKGYSLRQLGERISLHPTTLNKIENGINAPSIEVLDTIANFFDVRTSYFFGEEQPLPKELKDIGVEWLVFGEKMKDKNLTPEQLEEMVEFLKNFPK